MLPEHLTRILTVHKQSNRSLLTLGKPARPTQTQHIATQRQPNKSATSPALPEHARSKNKEKKKQKKIKQKR
jgi:hypothetical protein